jgi:hypothetical protein
MDKATSSELKLQLNFIAGIAKYAAVVRYPTYVQLFSSCIFINFLLYIFKVKFKTSTYRSILPGDTRAIFGLEPNYHVTPKIENFINYFPFNNNSNNVNIPYKMPEGTTGYFSIAAGSFIQEQTSEER